MRVWEKKKVRFRAPLRRLPIQKMMRYVAPVALVGLVLPLMAQAQTVFRFEHLGVKEGLSQSVVTATLQDREGYLWFATEEGLNRYDGYQFAVYRHDLNDSTTIASSRVGSLFEDRDGTLWVGTYVGLDRFDRATETFEHVWHHDEAYLASIVQDTTGALWIGTAGNGIHRMDPETRAVERVNLLDDRAHVQSMLQAQNGDIWIGYPLFCKIDVVEQTCEGPPIPAGQGG